MPLFFHNETADFQIGVWKITETIESLLSELPCKDAFISTLEQFKTDKRKLEWLAVRVLLKTMLKRETTIDYDSSGAPYLTDHSFLISISHTNGYAAVILHPTAKVGIDIEIKRDKVLHLRDKFLNEKELNIGHENILDYSLLMWSAKETVFKIINEEGINISSQLQVQPFKIAQTGCFLLAEKKTAQQQLFEILYQVEPDFVLTYAIQQ